MRRLALLILRFAHAMAPPACRRWSLAAQREAEAIDGHGPVLIFALGVLGWMLREVLVHHARTFGRETIMISLFGGARGGALACGVVATGLGLAYMAAGDAPARYLMINIGALMFGVAGLAIVGLAERRGHLRISPIVVSLGVAILAVSLWGEGADGVTRWLSMGPLAVQPSLIVLPLMMVLFARSRDALSAVGLAAAALGLALQPDRAMAGAMVAGLSVLAFLSPNRSVLAALATAAIGFAATLARADPSPAMPFVDGILYSAFDVHPLAGAAVLGGSTLLIAPAFARRPDPARAMFGAVWAALVVAAALGNYPTPLVGYSGSAVIGYMLSLIAFPHARAILSADADPHPTPADERQRPMLFAA